MPNSTPSMTTSAAESLGPNVVRSSDTSLLCISIVIPVRNEQAYIGQALDMLLAQEYPSDRMEILVIDGRSTDQTREVVERYIDRGLPVRLLDNRLRWSSAARNLGAKQACGDVVLVIDGHCQLPDRQHLRHVSQAFTASDADVVGRPQPLTVAGATPLQEAIALARASWLGHHPDSFIYSTDDRFVPAISVGAAYRRSVFDRIGYFDENFDACEDVDFNYRADLAQLKCYLSWKARVYYYPRATLAGLFSQLARYGRGRVRLARKHRETFSLKSFAPGLFVALWIVGALASCVSTTAFASWLVLNAIYAAVVLMTSLRIACRGPLRLALVWVPLVFATIHFAAGWGILWETLLGRRRTRSSDG